MPQSIPSILRRLIGYNILTAFHTGNIIRYFAWLNGMGCSNLARDF